MPVSQSKLKGLKGRVQVPKQRDEPAWSGPQGQGPNGGITFSALSRWLTCKERFRVQYVEGLKPAETFNSRMEFGNMWHVLEEGLAAFKQGKGPPWFSENGISQYIKKLYDKFPHSRQEVDEWANKVRAMFPLYVEHWRQQPDVQNRTPLLQEEPFDVPLCLPSGRQVRLRGKFDSVDLLNASVPCTCGADRTGPSAEAHTKKCPASKPHTTYGPPGIWLQENKTKSAIDTIKLTRQLTFDLQTMIYLVALMEYDLAAILEPKGFDAIPLLGVRYNVIRRSAHKSVESMLEKVEKDRAAGRIGEWFLRLKVPVMPEDVAKFRRECLDPVLENLCDDHEWWLRCFRSKGDVWDAGARVRACTHHFPRHFRFPFGVYAPLHESGASDIDSFLETGSRLGFRETEVVFPELAA